MGGSPCTLYTSTKDKEKQEHVLKLCGASPHSRLAGRGSSTASFGRKRHQLPEGQPRACQASWHLAGKATSFPERCRARESQAQMATLLGILSGDR